jgi:hypothetical protein
MQASNRMRSTLLLGLPCLFALTLLSAGCQNTPSKLDKWANTENSEELYKSVLLDPKSNDELRKVALFHLFDQADYSAAMLMGGGFLKDMPEATRSRAITDALPRIKAELLDKEGAKRIKARDLLYQVRFAVTDAPTKEAIDALLLEWVANSWNPQSEVGTVAFRDIAGILGAEKVSPILIKILGSKELTFAQVRGLQTQLRRTAWLPKADAVAAALLPVWDRTDIPNDPQLRVDFLDDLAAFTESPALQAWLVARAADTKTDPTFANIMMDMLKGMVVNDSLIASYTNMLQKESVSRWAAFQKLVEAKNSEGLELALSKLPVSGEYGAWDRGVVPNGFAEAGKSVCSLSKLAEMGDNARRVFEAHIGDANIHAAALSVRCLQGLGDANTIAKLEAAKSGANAKTEIPAWGGMKFGALLAESVTAIKTRTGGK